MRLNLVRLSHDLIPPLVAVIRSIEKAIPQAFAELNRQIFQAEVDGSVDVGHWVLHEGRLMEYDEAVCKFGPVFQILSPHDLIVEILKSAKGERVSVA